MPRVDPEMLRRVLCALTRLCPSPHCRVPREAVAKLLPSYLRGEAYRALEELRRQGLAYKAGGKHAYGPTREGLEKAREWCRED